VILRMSEQFSEVQNDMQCHLIGASSLFASKSTWRLDEPSVGSAPFWVYIRQNIRMCFLNEQPCQFDVDAYAATMSYSPAPDTVWTNRITYLLARLCTACWKPSESSTDDLDRFEHLQTSIDRWKKSLPESFQPWCHFEEEFEPFPTIRYVSIWHGNSPLFCLDSNLLTNLSCCMAVLLCRKSHVGLVWQETGHANLSIRGQQIHGGRCFVPEPIPRLNIS
jgi:hypothetical protein